jgi:hypothetical protein
MCDIWKVTKVKLTLDQRTWQCNDKIVYLNAKVTLYFYITNERQTAHQFFVQIVSYLRYVLILRQLQ